MRQIVAALLLAGLTVGGVVSVGPIAPVSAQVGSQGTITVGPSIEGVVTQKFTVDGDDGDYLIAVDGAVYQVPAELYHRVQVGSVVRFDGAEWSIAGSER